MKEAMINHTEFFLWKDPGAHFERAAEKQLHEPFEKQTQHAGLSAVKTNSNVWLKKQRKGETLLVTKERAVIVFVNSDGVAG